jgi:hypothetical protein
MDINWQDIILKIIIATPFGISAIVFFIIGFKRIERFFMVDYQGNHKEKFKDNFFGNVYMVLGVTCFGLAIIFSQEGRLYWDFLLIPLCFGLFILPISILGAYWRSYMTNKLWGGFMPIVRKHYGYAQPDPSKQGKFDPLKIKIPRRRVIIAILAALFAFLCSFYLISLVGWNGNALSGTIFRLFLSGLVALSIFMTIISVSLSRRILKLRERETLAEGDKK